MKRMVELISLWLAFVAARLLCAVLILYFIHGVTDIQLEDISHLVRGAAISMAPLGVFGLIVSMILGFWRKVFISLGCVVVLFFTALQIFLYLHSSSEPRLLALYYSYWQEFILYSLLSVSLFAAFLIARFVCGRS